MNNMTEELTDTQSDSNMVVDNSVIEAVEADKTIIKKIDRRVKNPNIINKRIDFNQKTFKKLQMMIPIYQNEIEIENAGQNETTSYVIKKAIDKLFDEEFKKIVESL